MISLPPSSLGPKPTKKQLALLTKMASRGATVRVWSGISLGSGGAYIDWHAKDEIKSENVSRGDVGKFYDWGWLTLTESSFKGQNYVVSERGRKVVAKGETR
jgi:hypothetical protein